MLLQSLDRQLDRRRLVKNAIHILGPWNDRQSLGLLAHWIVVVVENGLASLLYRVRTNVHSIKTFFNYEKLYEFQQRNMPVYIKFRRNVHKK